MSNKDLLEHAWKYFQLHAAQRIAVFNFFVAASGLQTAGLIYSLRGGYGTAAYSIAAGISLALLSVVFWKLDRRVSAMIKVSEEVIVKIEGSCIDEPQNRVMSMEQQTADATNYSLFGNWTYGQAFRRIFVVVGAVGILGAAFGGWQLTLQQPIEDTQAEQPLIDHKVPIAEAIEPGLVAEGVPPLETKTTDPVGADRK